MARYETEDERLKARERRDRERSKKRIKEIESLSKPGLFSRLFGKVSKRKRKEKPIISWTAKKERARTVARPREVIRKLPTARPSARKESGGAQPDVRGTARRVPRARPVYSGAQPDVRGTARRVPRARPVYSGAPSGRGGETWQEKYRKFEYMGGWYRVAKRIAKVAIVIIVLVLVFLWGSGRLEAATESAVVPSFVRSGAIKLGITAEETGIPTQAESYWSKFWRIITRPEEFVSGIGDWKNPVVKETEEHKQIAVDIEDFYSKKTVFKSGEVIETATDVTLYGVFTRDSKVNFICKLGDEIGVPSVKEHTIIQGYDETIHVGCKFKPKHTGETLVTETSRFQVITENFPVTTEYDVYTSSKANFDRTRELKENIFEGIDDNYLQDKKRTRAIMEELPLKLFVGIRDTQPVVDKRLYELGIGLAEDISWGGKLSNLESVRIAIPEIFVVQQQSCGAFLKPVDEDKLFLTRSVKGYNEYEFHLGSLEEINNFLKKEDETLTDADYWCPFILDSSKAGDLESHRIIARATYKYLYTAKAAIDVSGTTA